jgi:hypothetical protein
MDQTQAYPFRGPVLKFLGATEAAIELGLFALSGGLSQVLAASADRAGAEVSRTDADQPLRAWLPSPQPVCAARSSDTGPSALFAPKLRAGRPSEMKFHSEGEPIHTHLYSCFLIPVIRSSSSLDIPCPPA